MNRRVPFFFKVNINLLNKEMFLFERTSRRLSYKSRQMSLILFDDKENKNLHFLRISVDLDFIYI